MNIKRERTQVIHDILKSIQNKDGRIKPTHIQYKANLSSQMLKDYLNELVEKGFVNELIDKQGRKYSLTNKGFEYVSQYKRIHEFMVTFGLDEEQI